MHPELTAYLEEFEAKARARYDRQSARQDALLAKLLAGVSTPQPAHSPVVASDGGLAIDAADAAVLPEVSSSTTKALEVLPDASLDSIDPMPVTCSTDCSNQVVATAVCSEPAVDLNDHEVEQLAPARATPSIGTGTGTSSIAEEVAPSVVATTDVDPKAGVQATTDAFSRLVSSMTCEAYHLVDPSGLAVLALTTSWLVLRLTPRPSLLKDPTEGNKVRPIPWPSFSMGRFLGHPYTLNMWPPWVTYKEIYLVAIYTAARCLEFTRSTLHCLGISLVDKVLIVNELQLSSTQHGMGLRFLLPKPPWPFPIPTTSYLLYELVCCRDISSQLIGGEKSSIAVSTKACSLLLDNICLKCHIIHGEMNSKILQQSGILCVQPTNSVRAYMKLDEFCVAAVCMFEQGTSQDWGLMLCFKQRPPLVYKTQVHWKLSEKVACWIPMMPSYIPVLSQLIMPFMHDLTWGTAEWRLVILSVQSSYEFRAQDAQPMFGFSQKKAQLKLPGSYFFCNCQAVQFLVVHEHVTELAGSCSLAKISSQEKFKGSDHALISFHIEFSTTNMVLLSRDTTQLQSWPPPPSKHGTVPVHEKILWFHSWLGLLLFGDGSSLEALFGCHITRTRLMDKHMGLPPGGDTGYANWFHWKVKSVAKFGALMGKLPRISFYLPLVQPKHPWPFPIAAVSTQQLLFHMKPITEFVTILKIYSRLFQAGIPPLLGSQSASACHLEQFWDPGPGDNTLSVWIPHSLEYITHCRGTLSDGQNSVMSWSSLLAASKILFKKGGVSSSLLLSFAQDFADLEYYPGFDCGCADNGYILDWISIHHNYYFYLVEVYSHFDYHRDSDNIQEHRVHWDPGGCQWFRLGVKPNFKKGGMLGASYILLGTWAAPVDQHMGWTRLCASPSAADYKYLGGSHEETIQWIRQVNCELGS